MLILFSDCFPDLKIQQLRMNPRLWNRVLVDLKFTCHGFITKWHYFATRTGSVYLDVFKVNHDDSLTLISKTYVTANVTGVQSHTLAKEDWIQVEPGYIIGSHYQDGNVEAILTEDVSTFTLTTYTIDQLSAIWKTPHFYDDGFTVGSEYTPTVRDYVRFLPAINVEMSTSEYDYF